MNAYYNENDPYAAQWLRNLITAGHIADGEVDERSIKEVRADDIKGFTQCHWFAGIGVWSYALRRAGWSDDRAIWTGSCPCQPFSAAGQRKGTDDDRHLWPVWFDLIRECRPGVVLGEQVASKDALAWLDNVQDDLENEGYACGAVDTCSAGLGAPHIRQRLYFVGLADAVPAGRPEWRPIAGVGQATWGGEPSRLADADGRDASAERQQRRGEQRQQPQDSGTSGMGHPDSGRRQQQPQGNGLDAAGMGSPELVAVVACETSSNTSGLADADGTTGREVSGGAPGDENTNGRAGRDGSKQNSDNRFTGNGEDGDPGPTNGFWRDADWLHCRDDKWRPVVATHVALVAGTPASLGRMCADKGEEGEVNGLQALRQAVGHKEVFNRGERVAVLAGKTQVLRPGLHGEGDAQGQVQQFEPQPDESKPVGASPVRELPENGDIACAPYRPRSTKQRSCKLEDALRFMSPSLSLAKLYADRDTEKSLLALRQAIYEGGAVRDSSDSIETVWASIGEEEKDRIRVAFDASRWEIVDGFPLSTGESSRVGRLRGYGNAVNAQAAQGFIEAVMEVT